MASLTNSAVSTYRDCPRKYYYRYDLAIEPIDYQRSHALRFGSLYHGAQEVWWQTRDLVAVERYLQDQCAGIADDDEDSLIAYHTARLMMEGYVLTWDLVDEHIVMALPEQRFEVPIINPDTWRRSRKFTFRGMLDLPVLYQDGTIRLMEHKTAQTIGADYLERLWADTQITGYVASMRDIGLDVREVIYDVAKKPCIRRGKNEAVSDYARRLGWLYINGVSPGRLRQRKTETINDFQTRVLLEGDRVDMYHREIVIIGDRQIEEWRADLWHVAQGIMWSARTGRWPRNTRRCYDYGRVCQYAPICQSLGSEDIIIQTEYAPRERHVELDGVEEKPF